MESIEFDAALGGTEQLPHSANSLKFAASRSIEIATMTESILRPSKTKLIFQCLPVHMRRRVMSHNCKRLPRRLRDGHLEQLKKSGLPPKQKRPSRKYRRRPTNLLVDYNRRQKNSIWLETHIWHAKRFHMIEQWGHRIAYRPCDKAFRACYRASSAHCLLQDISYYTPIQIKGQTDSIKDLFGGITNSNCGLGITAKAFLNGNRKGTINLYMQNSYPFEFIGKIEFLWVCVDNCSKELWLFVHPSQVTQVELLLNEIIKSNTEIITSKDNGKTASKKMKIGSKYSDIQINIKSGQLNRFRLTGPKSHAVIVQTLKCVKDIEKIETNKWIEEITKKNTNLSLREKSDYWDNASLLNSPSQMPAAVVIGLVVRDPRLSRPTKRTKAQIKTDKQSNIELLLNVPSFIPTSPLWNETVSEIIKNNTVTNPQYTEHITNTQIIPGEINEDDPYLQSLPVVLLQRPGSQDSGFKKVGYGSGWDIIIPSEYGLAFWLTFIMFGARSGGLRETESLAFEMGETYMPPDSEAGHLEELRIESELKDKYFGRPPSKRVNFIKLAVPSPFVCPWTVLLKDWSNNISQENFYVLREKSVLDHLQNCITGRKTVSPLNTCEVCLVPVYLRILGKGNLTKHAMICLPNPQDISSKKVILEPHHEDGNLKLRRQKRLEHKKLLKQMRRKQIKLKKKRNLEHQVPKSNTKQKKSGPSDYVKSMRELWLPSNIQSVRNIGSKEVMGYVSQAAFSFSEAKSCGIGYVAFNGLARLLELGLNQVLVRNTTTRKYRLANIQIIKSP